MADADELRKGGGAELPAFLRKSKTVAVAVGSLEAHDTTLAWRYMMRHVVGSSDSLVIVRCVAAPDMKNIKQHRSALGSALHNVLSESTGPWTRDLLERKFEWLLNDTILTDIVERFPMATIVELDSHDSVREGILSWLQSSGTIDTLVIGSRGLTKLRRLLIGSVSSYLVKRAPCSVCVVREKAEATADATERDDKPDSRPRAVVICLDGAGTTGAPLCAYAVAHLLRPTDAVTLVHAPYKTKLTQESKDIAEAELADAKAALTSIVTDDSFLEAVLLDPLTDPRDAVVDFVDTLRPAGGCDLLVVAGHSTSVSGRAIKRAFTGTPSVATYCVEHARCPVTVISSKALAEFIPSS